MYLPDSAAGRRETVLSRSRTEDKIRCSLKRLWRGTGHVLTSSWPTIIQCNQTMQLHADSEWVRSLLLLLGWRDDVGSWTCSALCCDGSTQYPLGAVLPSTCLRGRMFLLAYLPLLACYSFANPSVLGIPDLCVECGAYSCFISAMATYMDYNILSRPRPTDEVGGLCLGGRVSFGR